MSEFSWICFINTKSNYIYSHIESIWYLFNFVSTFDLLKKYPVEGEGVMDGRGRGKEIGRIKIRKKKIRISLGISISIQNKPTNIAFKEKINDVFLLIMKKFPATTFLWPDLSPQISPGVDKVLGLQTTGKLIFHSSATCVWWVLIAFASAAELIQDYSESKRNEFTHHFRTINYTLSSKLQLLLLKIFLWLLKDNEIYL